MKNKIKNRLFDHLWLKFLAVLLSIMIWLIVMNVEDYTVTKQIKGIPVEQLNGDVIEELDKVYDVTEGETVDIVIKGRRTLVDALSAEDFMATADLSQMSITNTVQIVVTPKDKSISDEISITYVNNTMVLSIEDRVTAQLPLIVATTGNVADGYALGTCSATPNIITIEGPKSLVEKVTEIHAVVDVTNKYESFETEVTPVCYDVYGESMSGKKITLDTDKVKVSVPVYPTKEVPIRIKTIGTVVDGYVVTDVNYHPQTIRIAGEKDTLNRVSEIQVNNISVSGQMESMEVNVQIEDYLPSDIYLADSNQQIAVSISIEKLEERSFTPNASDIILLNKNDAYEYEILIPEGYAFQIIGLHDKITDLVISDLIPVIDCLDLEPGSHQIKLTLNENNNYSIRNEEMIELVVKEKAEAEDTAPDNGDEASEEE